MTKYCKRKGYTKATCECLRKAAKKGKTKSLKSAANLGLRLKGCKGAKGVVRKREKKTKK